MQIIYLPNNSRPTDEAAALKARQPTRVGQFVALFADRLRVIILRLPKRCN